MVSNESSCARCWTYILAQSSSSTLVIESYIQGRSTCSGCISHAALFLTVNFELTREILLAKNLLCCMLTCVALATKTACYGPDIDTMLNIVTSSKTTMTNWNLCNVGRCQPWTIQLVATQSEGTGLVQACLDRYWIYVCGSGWSDVDAAVACRQLGYSFYRKFQAKMYTYNSKLYSRYLL